MPAGDPGHERHDHQRPVTQQRGNQIAHRSASPARPRAGAAPLPKRSCRLHSRPRQFPAIPSTRAAELHVAALEVSVSLRHENVRVVAFANHRRRRAPEFPASIERTRRIVPNIAGLMRRSGFGSTTRTCSVRVVGSTASETTLTRPVQCLAGIRVQRDLRRLRPISPRRDPFRRYRPRPRPW